MSKHNAKTAIRERMQRTGENYTTARRAIHDAPSYFMAQYVRSNAPEVLEAVRQRKVLGGYLAQARKEFAREHTGDDGFYVTSSNAIVPEMTALAGDKPKTGRWKARGKGWVPAKNNPLLEEFEAMAKPPTITVPGMPEMIFALPWMLYCHPPRLRRLCLGWTVEGPRLSAGRGGA